MQFLREEKFYDLFQSCVKKLVEGAIELEALLKNFHDVRVKTKHIKDIEHERDLITHDTIDNLKRAFVTPLDREDIHDLITSLYDVLDYIEPCAERLFLFKIEKTTEEAILISCVATSSQRSMAFSMVS
jgi:uncharacterized protein